MDEVIRAKRQQTAASGMRAITIRGAREHNLKNIDLEIPRDKLVVFTGLSGSGKSSLAFDTIYAEGQRRYVESLSAYARQFLEMMQKPDVDQIDGLSPAISIEQKTTSKNPRSTVGTVTEIYDYMRLLWARVGVPYSPATGLPIESQIVSQMVDRVLALPEGTRLYLLAPALIYRGAVRDSMSGRPIQKANVLILGLTDEFHPTTTDKYGSFSIEARSFANARSKGEPRSLTPGNRDARGKPKLTANPSTDLVSLAPDRNSHLSKVTWPDRILSPKKRSPRRHTAGS